jgi:hypothetical protein
MLSLSINNLPTKKKIIIKKSISDVEKKLNETYPISKLSEDFEKSTCLDLKPPCISKNNDDSKILLKVKKNKKINKNNNLSKPAIIDNSNELSYDYNVMPQFLQNLNYKNSKINMNIINNLPQLKLKVVELNNYDNDKDNIDDDDIDNENINDEQDYDDIDKENLEIDKIGDTNYYFDYNKGIIYSMNFREVGHIDEYGEINLEE